MIEPRPPARLERSDAEPLDWFGSPLRFPVTCADTGELMSVQITELRPGAHNPLHCHGREDELFIVLRGRFVAEVGGRRVELETGDCAYIPAGVPHRVADAGPEPTTLATVLTPGALEEAFRTVAERGGRGLRETFRAAGVEFLESYDSAYRHPEADAPRDPVVVRAGERDRFHMAGDTYTIMLGGKDTADLLNIVHFDIPPGGGPIPHRHTLDDEVFIVTEGWVTLFHDGVTATAGPGDVAILPRGSVHAFRNETTEQAEMLALTAPSGFDGLIREVGIRATVGSAPAPIDDAEKARLARAVPKFGIELHPAAWPHG
ncbi:MAG: cupin domain-containing protein [Planctomycetota bacterium]